MSADIYNWQLLSAEVELKMPKYLQKACLHKPQYNITLPLSSNTLTSALSTGEQKAMREKTRSEVLESNNQILQRLPDSVRKLPWLFSILDAISKHSSCYNLKVFQHLTLKCQTLADLVFGGLRKRVWVAALLGSLLGVQKYYCSLSQLLLFFLQKNSKVTTIWLSSSKTISASCVWRQMTNFLHNSIVTIASLSNPWTVKFARLVSIPQTGKQSSQPLNYIGD